MLTLHFNLEWCVVSLNKWKSYGLFCDCTCVVACGLFSL